jgi:hypothetical protein
MSNGSDDNHELDYFDFQDVVAQRTVAFAHLAKLADAVRDETVKELCLSMLRKVSATIKTPSTADIRLITDADGETARK